MVTVVALLCGYVVVLVGLWMYARRHPEVLSLRDALRLLPDLLRLIRGLVGDPTLPWRVRASAVLLVAYLVSPIDLVPDVVPVLGYADDLVVVALVLRYVVRHAGSDALERHWPGTTDALAMVRRLAGLRVGD